ncbi:hypothetical protein F5J12DRAFT_785837 [Pisolithus orientalis]|uniref:uncharacterized protein n=1 Tax=Pisolithus orientalis TaxID=936130 RepID=UPI0022247710|nr:uncharacterized protein F5J12DRAFT_785837 [Pisolithus orientalis]KAI5994276.1 hypothetical protein F5J12DRAFT_785837 [Pisolithus orientalis]
MQFHDVTYLSPHRSSYLFSSHCGDDFYCFPIQIVYLIPATLPVNTALPSSKNKSTLIEVVVKLVYTITNKASVKPGVMSLPYIAQRGGACGRFSPYSYNQSCFLLEKKGTFFMAFCALLFFAYLVDLASFIPSPMLVLVWGAALGIELPIGEVAKFDLIILVKPIFTTQMAEPTHHAKHSHNCLHPYMCSGSSLTSFTLSASLCSSWLVQCDTMIWGASGNSVSGSDGTSTQATQYFSASSGSALFPSLDTGTSFQDTDIQSSSSSNTQSSLVNLEACIISIVQCHLADFQGPMDEKFCNNIDFWNHAEVHEKGRLSQVASPHNDDSCDSTQIMYQQQGQTESVGSKKLFIPGAWSQLDGQTNKKNTEKHGVCNQATNSKQ